MDNYSDTPGALLKIETTHTNIEYDKKKEQKCFNTPKKKLTSASETDRSAAWAAGAAVDSSAASKLLSSAGAV